MLIEILKSMDICRTICSLKLIKLMVYGFVLLTAFQITDVVSPIIGANYFKHQQDQTNN